MGRTKQNGARVEEEELRGRCTEMGIVYMYRGPSVGVTVSRFSPHLFLHGVHWAYNRRPSFFGFRAARVKTGGNSVPKVTGGSYLTLPYDA